MYPNLYYAFKDLFGIEWGFLKMFQSFGFFVALSFILASYLFSIELKRKEKEGLLQPTLTEVSKGKKSTISDYVISLLFGFVLGYKLLYVIIHFNVFLENTQGFILSKEGSIIGGMLLASIFFFMKYMENRQLKNTEPQTENLIIHPYERVGTMTTIAAISGLVGAKIFHNLENWDDFVADPAGALLSFSGLTMYGGLICGSLSVIYYAYKNKIAVKPLIDACAPGLMLAYGVGRIGCQVAGDGDWGIDNPAPKPNWLSHIPDWFWSYNYPHNVLKEHLNVPVFPTPLYESIVCIALFFVLWSVRKKIRIPAVMFCLYLLLNGLERFFIEKIRINTQYHIAGYGITQAEIISTLLIIVGAIGIWWFKKKSRSAYNKSETTT
jgi:phosphatidylglycerol:prolipoprotein diacylglycerol transferase